MWPAYVFASGPSWRWKEIFLSTNDLSAEKCPISLQKSCDDIAGKVTITFARDTLWQSIVKSVFSYFRNGMRNLLDLMAISFITITFCNTVQQKIYYSHILPGNDGLDHSLACENGKYVGGRCNILTISQLWQLFIREKKKRNQIETVWAIEDKVVGKY